MRLTSRFLLATVVFLAPGTALAQTTFWVEGYNEFSGRNVTPYVNGLFFSTVKGSVGTYGWFQVSEGYGQGYYGLTFAPNSLVQFGTGVGIENGSNRPRVGLFLWCGHEGHYFLGIFEDGGAERWYKAEVNFKITKILGLGGLYQAFLGLGPRVEVNLPRTPIKIYATWTGKREGIASVRFSF